MPKFALGVVSVCALIPLVCAQDFSGSWRLKSQRVEYGNLPEAPAVALEIVHQGHSIRCTAGSVNWSFTTDGKDAHSRIRQRSVLTTAKWEGSALLINTIVSDSGRNYTQMDRWVVSRDRSLLTVTREIAGRSVEATLIYERTDAQPAFPSRPDTPGTVPPAAQPKLEEYTVEAGTRVLLVLDSSISMKHSAEGDRVYLRTAYPVLSKGEVVIPVGSNVAGTLTFVKPPGKVQGRGEVYIRFDSLTLPNGVTRDFHAKVNQVDASTQGRVDPKEGSIKGEGHPGEDAGTIAKTTTAGATVGGIGGAAAGHGALGLGVGAAAGAVAGVLLAHGKDTVLQPGTSVEMTLDRPLVYSADELPRRFRRAN